MAAKNSAGTLLRHLHVAATAGTDCPATDRELLERFARQHDEAAFAALFRRHGAMVLATGRRILGDLQGAEDICQATFLLLARKAGSGRWQESVAGWLYQTAQHLALKSRTSSARRTRRERSVAPRQLASPLTEITAQEFLTALDGELLRLPERFRSPLVLCYLEGSTQEHAARQLGCPLTTLRDRLGRGLKRLRAALTRRGLELSAVLLATALTQRTPRAAAANLMARRTARAALALALGQTPNGLVSANVARLLDGGLTTMGWKSSKTMLAGFILIGLLSGAGALRHGLRASPETPTPAGPAATPAAPATEQPGPAPATGAAREVSFRGRVVGPDGKAVAGAPVYVQAAVGAPIERARTAADGRFTFRLRPGEVLDQDKRVAHAFQVVAAADGFGPAWISANDTTSADNVTLRLVKDDAIEGRIVTQEGKPVAGAQVRVLSMGTSPYGQMTLGGDDHLYGGVPRHPQTVSTDGDGRFRLTGVGRGRIVQLTIEGPGIAWEFLQAHTADAKVPEAPQGMGPRLYGAKFEHRAQPGRSVRGVVREKGTGKPLAGVMVGGGGTSSRTDANGRYELPGWAKAREYYVIVGSGDRDHLQMFTAVADTAGLGPLTAPDTELTRGIPFHGKIIDKGTGKPVSRGEIWYWALWPNAEAIKLTPSFRYGYFSRAAIADDGTFTCPVLPGPGAVTLMDRNGEDYLPASVDPVAFFKDKMGDTAHLTGNREHLMVVGATPPYTPRPSVQPQDQFQAIVLINPDGDTREIRREIALEPARKVKVTVVGSDGKPLAGARVRGRKEAFDWETAPGAEFLLRGSGPKQRHPRTLLVVHEATRQIGTLRVTGDETGPLEVRLRPWATVTGRLLNADGEPCGGSLINAETSDRSIAYPPSMRIKTNNDGSFRIEGMVPGVKYRLDYAHVSPAGRIEAKDLGTITELTLKEGETRSLGNVTGRPLRNQ
jgi:RNA polymerase sigma factor (sigma-70 family)